MRFHSRGVHPPRLDSPPLSNEAWELIQTCWVREASKRPRIEVVRERMAQSTRHPDSDSESGSYLGSGAVSDARSGFEVPFRGDRAGHAYKRRRIDKTAARIADDLEWSLELESVSVTPKAIRKRPMIKRPLDLAPDDVEMGSVSSAVHELDEVIPPLKRARKVNAGGMLKRVKTLEENQRKVWTNIAKRDVIKVSVLLYDISSDV